jgi:hypothetical protein
VSFGSSFTTAILDEESNTGFFVLGLPAATPRSGLGRRLAVESGGSSMAAEVIVRDGKAAVRVAPSWPGWIFASVIIGIVVRLQDPHFAKLPLRLCSRPEHVPTAALGAGELCHDSRSGQLQRSWRWDPGIDRCPDGSAPPSFEWQRRQHAQFVCEPGPAHDAALPRSDGTRTRILHSACLWCAAAPQRS